MRVFFVLAILVATLSAANAAQARDCKGPGDRAAQIVLSAGTFYSEGVMQPAAASAWIALTGEGYPRKDIKAENARCPRGEFTTKTGGVYTLYGADENSQPPRYAVAGDKASIAFLALGPSVEDAAGWLRAGSPKTNIPITSPVWILTTLTGDRAQVFRFYNAIPDDRRLIADMTAALDGPSRPIVFMDMKTGDISSAPEAAGQAVGPGSGDVEQVRQMRQADGTIFRSDNAGGVVHLRTGFVCPSEWDGYRRNQLVDFRPRQNGADVACSFGREDGWFTVYITQVEPQLQSPEVFQSYTLQAQAVAPPQASLPTPPVAGAQYGRFWTSKEGQAEGLWVARHGDWYLKVRATTDPASLKDMSKGAADAFAAARSTLGAPTP